MAVKPPKPGRLIGGIPAYTKQQFLKVRPGGNYGSYVDVLNKKRGLVPGKPPTLSSLMSGMRFETPAQIEARANRMTAANIAAQKGLAADAAKTAQDEALRVQAAQTQAAQTVAKMNEGLFAGVGGEFNAGARELANLATGGISNATLGTDATVASTNEALARVGMPGVVGMAGPEQAGVVAYQGAQLPAQRMATQSEAAQFGLAGMIRSQHARSTQEANAALTESTRAIAEQKQLAYQEIARGRPEIAAKILSDLQTAERQNVALGMSLLEAQRGVKNTEWEKGITERKLTAAEKEAAAAAKAADAKMRSDAAKQGIEYGRIDASASKAAGFLVDRAGRPILGKNGKPIPVAKTGAAAKPKSPTKIPGLTPNQAQKQIEKAQDLAATLFYGYANVNGRRVPATQSGTFNPDNPNTYGTGYVQYGPALKRVMQLGVPRGMAVEMLNQYYERGDQGRPLFNAAEQKAIKAKLNKDFGKDAKRQWNIAIMGINRALDQGYNDVADHKIADLLSLLR